MYLSTRDRLRKIPPSHAHIKRRDHPHPRPSYYNCIVKHWHRAFPSGSTYDNFKESKIYVRYSPR